MHRTIRQQTALKLLSSLRELLANDTINGVCDKGPRDEGWQSDELAAQFLRAYEAIDDAEGDLDE